MLSCCDVSHLVNGLVDGGDVKTAPRIVSFACVSQVRARLFLRDDTVTFVGVWTMKQLFGSIQPEDLGRPRTDQHIGCQPRSVTGSFRRLSRLQ